VYDLHRNPIGDWSTEALTMMPYIAEDNLRSLLSRARDMPLPWIKQVVSRRVP